MEMCKSMTGADPDISIGFGKKSIGVCVFPNQAVRMSIVMPAASLKSIHSAVHSRPHRAIGTRTQEIVLVGTQAVLLRVMSYDWPVAALRELQTRHTAGLAVADPQSSVRRLCKPGRHVYLQSVIRSKAPPLAILEAGQTVGAGKP